MKTTRRSILVASIAIALAGCSKASQEHETPKAAPKPYTPSPQTSDGGGQHDPEKPFGDTDFDIEEPPPEGEQIPPIGSSDTLEGLSDGKTRPNVQEIPTGELDETRALEAAEKFRRYLQNPPSNVDAWHDVCNTTIVACIKQTDMTVLKSDANNLKRRGYTLDGPHPQVFYALLEANGEEVCSFTLEGDRMPKNPSVCTWRVAAITSSRLTNPLSMLSERNRLTDAQGAYAVTKFIVTQHKDQAGDTMQMEAKRGLREPKAALTIAPPYPEANTFAFPEPISGFRYVTPRGSEEIWIYVSQIATAHDVNDPQSPRNTALPVMYRDVWVKMRYVEGAWEFWDAQLTAPDGALDKA